MSKRLEAVRALLATQVEAAAAEELLILEEVIAAPDTQSKLETVDRLTDYRQYVTVPARHRAALASNPDTQEALRDIIISLSLLGVKENGDAIIEIITSE